MNPFHSLSRLLPVLLVLPTLAAQEEAAHSNWIADYDQAVTKAKAEKKDLIVDFTGSDWCGWCIKLDSEVFAHDEFLNGVKDKYVLCALDFPRDEAVKAKVPNPARNEELQEKYGVGGFPTILLMDTEGVVFAKTGYQPGGPAKYVAHLTEIATTGKAAVADAKKLAEAHATAKGDAQVKVLQDAATLLEGLDGDSPAAAPLGELVRKAFALDKTKHAALRKSAVLALLKSGQADDETRTIAREIDPKNADGLLEQVVLAQASMIDSAETAKAIVAEVESLMTLKFKDKKVGGQLVGMAAFLTGDPRVFGDKAKAAAIAKQALSAEYEIENPGMKVQLEKLAKAAGDTGEKGEEKGGEKKDKDGE